MNKVTWVALLVVLMMEISIADDHHGFEPGHNYSCVYVGHNEMNCTYLFNGSLHSELFLKEEKDVPFTTVWYIHAAICVVLVLSAGLFSGLTMGLMSLDLMNLKILSESGTNSQKKYSKRIMPLVKRHHLLLVTLLLANAAAMEALPIFLNKVVGDEVASIIISVTLVLFFGEVIPQAICSRYGLAIGYIFAYPVWTLIGLLVIVAWPISKILDCLIGKNHTAFFRRAELKELMDIHLGNNDSEDPEHRGPLTIAEVKIIKGALNMRDKTALDSLTPLDEVFSLELGTILNQDVLNSISNNGHSRIPVYRKDKSTILGIILSKNLIHVHPSDEALIDDLEILRIPYITSCTPLFKVLNQFTEGKIHIAIVLDTNDFMSVLGIITLEDVIESLLDIEIEDEFDIIRRNNEKVVDVMASVMVGSKHIPADALIQPVGEDVPLLVGSINNA
eukprot:TRINITY_DN9706_c0_g1_i1.p1 TRINITY_DN9706_c0_g1~~TRINITY_DN9706_c0_g1_i1.p1  ORF type:complete len:448 (-),score=78.47 TRINITY_DN9706_c0_g1_i1:59-1402(-)